MDHKDTLALYDALLAGGCTEPQARVQAAQLGAMGDSLSRSIDNVDNRLRQIDKRLISIDKDMLWMRAIGAAMIVAFFSNGFFFWLK